MQASRADSDAVSVHGLQCGGAALSHGLTSTVPDARIMDLCAEVVGILVDRGLRLGVAESLTGGLVTGCLTAIPGVSAVLPGGVVAYSDAVKSQVLGVQPALLTQHTAVSAPIALRMAVGVRHLLRCDVGVATTGEAGPSSLSGKPPGRFFVGLSAGGSELVECHDCPGDREAVRAAALWSSLFLVRRWLVGA